MSILDAIKETNRPLLIITTHTHKVRILRRLHADKILKPVQFMTPNDLFDKVFFNVKPGAAHALSQQYGKKEAIVETWLHYLPEIDVDVRYNTPRLNHLQAVKKSLVTNALVQPNPFGSLPFKNKKTLIYGAFNDPVVEHRLTRLQETLAMEWLPFDDPQTTQATLSVHETAEAEIIACALTILERVKAGKPLSEIKLFQPPASYTALIKEIFAHFNLPINVDERQNLLAFPTTQAFLRFFNETETADYVIALKQAFERLDKQYEPTEASFKLKTLLNPTVQYVSDKAAGYAHIRHRLENTTVSFVRQTPAVETIRLDDWDPTAIDTVFILGMNVGNHPAYQEESDYLSAEEKKEIGYPTATEGNQKRKTDYLNRLKKVKNCVCSYARNDETGPIEPSDILDNMALKTVDSPRLINQRYSESYDRIRIKKYKDTHDVYGTVHPDLPRLYARFKNNYNRYDNRFTGLKNATLEKLKPRKQISVTRIESFFKCQYRFLLEHFLRLPGEENRLALDRGNLVHYALENGITDKKELLKHTKSMFEANPDATAKEWYFLTRAIDEALPVVDIIKTQEQRSFFAVDQREAMFETPINHGFYLRGKIDKILRDDRDVVLIDYKTGQATLNLKTAVHGIGGQLVYYALLYRANHPTVKFVGLYEQTVMPQNIKKEIGKTKAQRVEEMLRMKGTTTTDFDALARLDPDFEKDNRFIDKLNFKKDGTFTKTVKSHSQTTLDALLDHVNRLLLDAVDCIDKGDFVINPKIQGKTNHSCQYCPFNDICYKTPRDFVTLKNYTNQHDVFDAIRKGRD